MKIGHFEIIIRKEERKKERFTQREIDSTAI